MEVNYIPRLTSAIETLLNYPDEIMNKHHPLLSLLNELEAELKTQQLWSSQPPTKEQLNSQVPFAADVMPFELWLQFVFIARFRYMIEHDVTLPTTMSITPMAEIVYAATQPKLIEILANIDALFQE